MYRHISVLSEERPRGEYRRRWAVIVGVVDYGPSDTTRIRSLRNAVNDACAVYRRLTQSFEFDARLLCRPEDVRRSTALFASVEAKGTVDQELERATRGNGSESEIIDSIYEIGDRAHPDDLFLFYFGGHGTPEVPGYLLPYGAQLGRYSTYLMYETLFGVLSNVPCRHKIVILDCCFSGGALGLNTSKEKVATGGPESEAIVTLAAADYSEETADDYEDNNNGVASFHSPFTSSLLDVLGEFKDGESRLVKDVCDDVAQRTLTLGSRSSPNKAKKTAHPRLDIQGHGNPVLLRPGFRVEIEPTIHIHRVANATSGAEPQVRSVPMTIRGGSPPFDVRTDPVMDGIRCDAIGLTIDPRQIGEQPVDLGVIVTDSRSRNTRALCTVIPMSSSQRRLALETESLPPAIVGSSYATEIEVSGGTPPYRVSIAGLPLGLSLIPSRGIVAGIPSSHSGRSSVTMTTINVKDHDGAKVERRFRFAAIDRKDYCEIPSGIARVGLSPNAQQGLALARLRLAPDSLRYLRDQFPFAEVFVPRFFIKRYPVTQAEWRTFLDATGQGWVPRRWATKDYDPVLEAMLPVTGISLDAISQYCSWRGSRLASALEWEKAARGGDGRLFPWGDEFDANRCNSLHLGVHHLTSVDQFPEGASPYGCCDMVGNAWEVTSEAINTAGSWSFALRGGSWSSSGQELLPCFPTMINGAWYGVEDDHAPRLRGRQCDGDDRFGFRDVIEIEDAPPFPQGLVNLGHSSFKSGQDVVGVGKRRISRYPVSNAEYLEFVKATGRIFPPHWVRSQDDPFPFEDRHFPVTNVSFNDAKDYCEWFSRHSTDAVQVLDATSWRSAVQGPGSSNLGYLPRNFPWGMAFDRYACNTLESRRGGLVRVFDIPESRSSCGSYHLFGNTSYWCAENTVVGASWRTPGERPVLSARTCPGPRSDVSFRYMAKL